MTLSISQWTVWILAAVGEAAVAVRMTISGARRRWPSLFWFLAILTMKDAARFANIFTLRNAWLDFYSFWSLSLIALVCELWIVIQIAHAMLGISPLARKWLTHTILYMAALSSAASITISFRGHAADWQYLCGAVDRLTNAIALGWAVMLVVVAAFSDQLAEWSGDARAVAVGLTLELTADSYIGWLRITTGHVARLDLFKGSIFLVSLFMWGAATGRQRDDAGSPLKLSQVLTVVQNLLKIFRAARTLPQ